MKKQLLLLSGFVCAMVAVNAQQKLSFSTAGLMKQKATLTNKVSGINQVASPSQVTGSIYSTGYVAGVPNYALDMSLFLTNTDGEFVDSVAIAFPAGITPVSSPNTTFPSAITTASLLESYNGVVGQVISWGDDDNVYGGVADVGNGLNFQVLVNTVGGLTGVQTLTLYISGDTYAMLPGDASGTFTIAPKPATDLSLVNMFVPSDKCTNGSTEQLSVWFRNLGTSPASSFTLSYTINGGTPVVETYTGTAIAPGDTLKYTYVAQANLSAVGVYSIACSALITGDPNTLDNSFTMVTETFPKNNVPYQTGFESLPASELQNWVPFSVSGNQNWSVVNNWSHSGINSANVVETTNGISQDWLFSSCLNLQTGKTYYVRYWYNLYTGANGALSIFADTVRTTTMSQVIKPVTLLTPSSTWSKDSISFTVPTTDVYYLAFVGMNSSSTSKIDLAIDDIKIDEIPVVTEIKSVDSDELSVYPNPTNGILNIYSPNSYLTIEIYNTIGQHVVTTKTTAMGSNLIDVSSLPVGAYTVKLSNDRNLVYKRIIIQK